MRLTWRIDWSRVSTRYLPFADGVTDHLPWGRLIRLALFQLTVGMVAVLTVGTLNRVMIVEIGVGAWLVSCMVALPLLIAPFRALIGWKSDIHRSPLGWRRVPYIWMGSALQFAGLAIMPFAIVLLGGQTSVQLAAGHLSAALAFLMAGAGAQVVQTAGLALATDLAPAKARPRVVAMMYAALLLGMVCSGLVFSALLENYSATRLVQVVQGTAALTLVLNLVAVWKQEPRDRQRHRGAATDAAFVQRWREFSQRVRARRFLLAVGLGTAAFNMQDVILEPFGAEVLGLSVSQTTLLTGFMAGASLVAFVWAARRLSAGMDALRLAARGLLWGVAGFTAVIFADPVGWPALFLLGVGLIGLGAGLFSVGTLTCAMSLDGSGFNGMVLGAWGGAVAAASGLAVALGGALRDAVSSASHQGAWGEVLSYVGAGYEVVYHVELVLLFATLVVLGPLVGRWRDAGPTSSSTGEHEHPTSVTSRWRRRRRWRWAQSPG